MKNAAGRLAGLRRLIQPIRAEQAIRLALCSSAALFETTPVTYRAQLSGTHWRKIADFSKNDRR